MLRLLPLVSLLVACGGGEDTHQGFTTNTTKTGSQAGSCVVLEERALAIDEFVTEPLSMAPEDVLVELTGVSNTTNVFTWPDENTIDLEIEFTYTDGPITYVARDNEGVLSPAELEYCFTAIEFEGSLTFTTGDGAFAETAPVTLQAKARRDGVIVFTIPQGSLGGSWTPDLSGIDAAAYPNLDLLFEGDITNLGSSGTITGVSGSDELPVGTWSPPPTNG